MLIILVIYFRNKLVKRRMIQTHYNYNNNNNKKKINQLKLKRKRIKILKYSNKSNHNPK